MSSDAFFYIKITISRRQFMKLELKLKSNLRINNLLVDRKNNNHNTALINDVDSLVARANQFLPVNL